MRNIDWGKAIRQLDIVEKASEPILALVHIEILSQWHSQGILEAGEFRAAHSQEPNGFIHARDDARAQTHHQRQDRFEEADRL